MILLYQQHMGSDNLPTATKDTRPIYFPSLPKVTDVPSSLPNVASDSPNLSIREQIIKLFCYSSDNSLSCPHLPNILSYLKKNKVSDFSSPEFKLFFQFILFSRECNRRFLSFRVVYHLYDYFPEWAFYAIRMFVYKYGSWRDIRDICSFVKSECHNTNHPIILLCVELANKELGELQEFLYTRQHLKVDSERRNKDLLSSIPREKSRDAWLWKIFVNNWNFSQYLSCNSEHHREYRHVLSELKVLTTLTSNECEPSLKMPSLYSIVESVISYKSPRFLEWKRYIAQFGNFGKLIPIVDARYFRTISEMYSAIGMACVVCEKTEFGRRVLVIHPTNTMAWVNLETVFDIGEMIKLLYSAIHYRMEHRQPLVKMMEHRSSLIDAFKFIIQPFNYLPGHFFKDYNFIIFSNYSDEGAGSTGLLHQDIISLFTQNYLPCGNIIYWNLLTNPNDNYPIKQDNAIYIRDATGRCLFLLASLIRTNNTTNTLSFFSRFLSEQYNIF